MSLPVRIGVLGCASVASYALIEPARHVPGVVVSAVASRSVDRAAQFAERHRIAGVYGAYEDLIGDPEIDLVYNPLPNSLHCEWSVRALRAGKAVLCEKPLAANASEAAQMAATARQARRPLIEAFHFRYHPVADRIREIVSSGSLGRLGFVEARFLVPPRSVGADNIRLRFDLAGGATMDPGCYCVNILRMVTGEEPGVIRASAVMGPEHVDLAMQADLGFPSGCRGRIACSLAHEQEHWDLSLKVVGERSELEVTNPFLPHGGHSIRLTHDGATHTEELERVSTYVCQLRDVVRVLREGASIRTPADDGVRNMKVIDDIYLAAGMRPRGSRVPH